MSDQWVLLCWNNRLSDHWAFLGLLTGQNNVMSEKWHSTSCTQWCFGLNASVSMLIFYEAVFEVIQKHLATAVFNTFGYFNGAMSSFQHPLILTTQQATKCPIGSTACCYNYANPITQTPKYSRSLSPILDLGRAWWLSFRAESWLTWPVPCPYPLYPCNFFQTLTMGEIENTSYRL